MAESIGIIIKLFFVQFFPTAIKILGAFSPTTVIMGTIILLLGLIKFIKKILFY